MRILMAAMGLDIGGAETHIVELCRELKRRGNDVAVVSHGGAYVPEIVSAGVRHYEAPLHRRSLSAMRRAKAALREAVEKERPDVVHAHARIPGFLCGRLQRSMGFPFVTTCHGVYRTGAALRLLSDWGQRTLAVSEDIRDYLIREYGLPEGRIALTVNGVDTEKFSPAADGSAVRAEFALGGGPVVVHVSRMDRESVTAAMLLTEIAPELDRRFPGVQIVLAGGGTEFGRLAAAAQEVNRKLGRPCVVAAGPRTDIAALCAAGDVFVGVSRAALEAMAEEKPAVLSGAQGHAGLFTPEGLKSAMETNFCCRGEPPATAERLLSDVSAALALPEEEKRRLGACGRQVVRENYSVERMASDALAVYDRVRRRKYRAVLCGYYGFANAGDDAILQSICQSVREASGEVALTALSNDPALTEASCPVDAVPRFRPGAVRRALKESDALIFGGGSLLQDRTSTRSLLYYVSVIRAARMLGRPVMLYANGIGPVEKRANRKRVARAVESAAVVTLRDRDSARELREMGVRRGDLTVTADPVFRLDPAGEERSRELLRSAGLSGDAPFAAVSVRPWPGTGDFPAALAALCDHLREAHGLAVLFVLMQPAADRAASQAVRDRMKGESFLLEAPCTPAELMGVIAEAKLCLAMRLHTLIFAARTATPVLGLPYDPKVAACLQELDMPSAGDVRDFRADRAAAEADALLADYDRRKAALRERSRTLTESAGENVRLLLELLERTRP